MGANILANLLHKEKNGQKSLAVLIDPDKIEEKSELVERVDSCEKNDVDFILVGGSLISNKKLPVIIQTIKMITNLPVAIFPGSNLHISDNADAILFLTLISGRNPEYLIGQHVVAAPILKDIQIEVIPTGYILIDGGIETSVSYLSDTKPIPRTKPDLVRATAIAGEFLGLRMIYLEAGSGAKFPVPDDVIREVRKAIRVPLIVGGGLNTRNKAWDVLNAGADIIVIGNGIENNIGIINEVASCVKEWNALNVH